MKSASPSTASRPWPVFAWLQGYQRGWLRLDVIAGLTVCAILVPEGMAYAELAGVPPETRFYAAPAALLAYAVAGQLPPAGRGGVLGHRHHVRGHDLRAAPPRAAPSTSP